MNVHNITYLKIQTHARRNAGLEIPGPASDPSFKHQNEWVYDSPAADSACTADVSVEGRHGGSMPVDI